MLSATTWDTCIMDSLTILKHTNILKRKHLYWYSNITQTCTRNYVCNQVRHNFHGNIFLIRVIWRVPQVKQKLLTFPEHLSAHTVSSEVNVAQSFTDSEYSFVFKLFFHFWCCVVSIIVCLFILIPLGIVLYVPVPRLFATSDYIFGILTFFYYFLVRRCWYRLSGKS